MIFISAGVLDAAPNAKTDYDNALRRSDRGGDWQAVRLAGRTIGRLAEQPSRETVKLQQVGMTHES